MVKELVYKNRSYRRFYEDFLVSEEQLVELVDLARVSASGRNLQPLKFLVSSSRELNLQIYPTLAWAGYLKDWDGPEEGERPSAYIVILEDTSLGQGMVHDQGIACQSILLGAVEQGLGGCIIASVRKQELAALLKLPDHLKVALVVALGKPKEEVLMVDVKGDGDIKYWRDAEGRHYVPKRTLEEVLVKI